MQTNNLIEVYVNGVWTTSFEDNEKDNTLYIYDEGTIYYIKPEKYDEFIDDLENKGYDCYLCPQLFSHPNWNGIIKFI